MFECITWSWITADKNYIPVHELLGQIAFARTVCLCECDRTWANETVLTQLAVLILSFSRIPKFLGQNFPSWRKNNNMIFTVAVQKLKFMIAVIFAVFPNTRRDYCWHFSGTLISCKEINASSFLVPRKGLVHNSSSTYIFAKFTHPAARFVCDSWPTCILCIEYDTRLALTKCVI